MKNEIFANADVLTKQVLRVNKIICYIYAVLTLAPLVVFILCKVGLYNYPQNYALIAHILSIIVCVVLFILLQIPSCYRFYKYFAALSIQVIVFLLSLDVNLQLTITYMIVPMLAMMYCNVKFTLYSCTLSLISMLIGKWLCAEQAIQLFWPGITKQQYMLTTAGGHVLEFILGTIVLCSASSLARQLIMILQNRTKEVVNIQNQMVYSFADMIESRDGTTGQHVKRTSQTVSLISDYLLSHRTYEDVSSVDYKLIAMAAPLHDIGKMKVPDSILSKPGKLTKEEFEIIKTHSTEGGKIIDKTMSKIEDAHYVKIAKEMALFHHEKWNGQGYPKGLEGPSIPISARIMAIADVFDALCSSRSYKEAFSIDEAYNILEQSRGTHFEPCLVDVMVNIRPQLEKIYR